MEAKHLQNVLNNPRIIRGRYNYFCSIEKNIVWPCWSYGIKWLSFTLVHIYIFLLTAQVIKAASPPVNCNYVRSKSIWTFVFFSEVGYRIHNNAILINVGRWFGAFVPSGFVFETRLGHVHPFIPDLQRSNQYSGL